MRGGIWIGSDRKRVRRVPLRKSGDRGCSACKQITPDTMGMVSTSAAIAIGRRTVATRSPISGSLPPPNQGVIIMTP